VSKRELFRRHLGNPILTAESWPYPANAVFNPAAAAVDGQTVLLARVEDLIYSGLRVLACFLLLAGIFEPCRGAGWRSFAPLRAASW
jgi:predicted GH43/DUF377 family glycosyl hydrolase